MFWAKIKLKVLWTTQIGTQIWPLLHSLVHYFHSVLMDRSEAPTNPSYTFGIDSASQALSLCQREDWNSALTPTPLAQVPLYRAQHAQPYMVILGSTLWKRSEEPLKLNSTTIFLGFIYYVVKHSGVLWGPTVWSINKLSWPSMNAFLGEYKIFCNFMNYRILELESPSFFF